MPGAQTDATPYTIDHHLIANGNIWIASPYITIAKKVLTSSCADGRY